MTVPYEEIEIDGVLYYHVAVNLAAAESLEDIKLAVTLNSGKTIVTANWTLSVLNYTKSVINGNYDNPEIEVVEVNASDIITTSPGTETPWYEESDGVWELNIDL